MLDEAIDQAEQVSEEVDAVAEANDEQAAEVREINRVIDRLRGD